MKFESSISLEKLAWNSKNIILGFEPDSKCCILQSLYNNEIIGEFRNSGIFGFMKIYVHNNP